MNWLGSLLGACLVYLLVSANARREFGEMLAEIANAYNAKVGG